jgi:hypothetical protein
MLRAWKLVGPSARLLTNSDNSGADNRKRNKVWLTAMRVQVVFKRMVAWGVSLVVIFSFAIPVTVIALQLSNLICYSIYVLYISVQMWRGAAPGQLDEIYVELLAASLPVQGLAFLAYLDLRHKTIEGRIGEAAQHRSPQRVRPWQSFIRRYWY